MPLKFQRLASPRAARRLALLGVASLCGMLVDTSSWAAANAELGYTRLQVYSGALRYLRIDLGYEVTEKNADAAYLLFEYRTHEREDTTFGAFEIIETKDGVRLAVKLPQMPSYHERVLRDGLVRKLREDYGQSRPEPPPKSKKKPPQDEAHPAPEPDRAPDGKLPVEQLPETDAPE